MPPLFSSAARRWGTVASGPVLLLRHTADIWNHAAGGRCLHLHLINFDRARGHEIGALLITLLVCPGFQDYGLRLVVYQSLRTIAGGIVDGATLPIESVRARLSGVLTEHQERTLEWNIALGRSVLPMLAGLSPAAEAARPVRKAPAHDRPARAAGSALGQDVHGYYAAAPVLHVAAAIAGMLGDRTATDMPGAWQDVMLDAAAVRRWVDSAIALEPLVARFLLPHGHRLRARPSGAGNR